MSKHTRGKWRAATNKFGFGIYDDQDNMIASRHHHLPRLKADCDDANARLLAAAPTLLELLKKAVARQGFSNEELIDARAEIKRIEGGEG